MTKIYRKHNYIYIVPDGQTETIEALAKDVKITLEPDGNFHFYEKGLELFNQTPDVDIVDENENPYTDFEEWKNINTGFNTASGGSGASRLVEVSSLSDLPNPVGGVITLEDFYSYYILIDLDLDGDRIQLGENTCIFGVSSENSSITSTGLGVGVPLITGSYSFPLFSISIKDVDTAFDLDGTGNTMALDWTGVNIVNVNNIGVITTASNFIFDKGTFAESMNLEFDGTIGTIAINNSLLRSDGTVGNIVKLRDTLTLNTRFRIIYSSIIVTGSSVGLNVSNTASIGVERYILDVVNFSGGGTYLSGVTHTSNKSLFTRNNGIINSSELSVYSMQANATPTVVASTGLEYKVLGTTTSDSITSKFTNTNNRATYTGAIARFFTVTSTMSVTSGNNNQIGGYIAKNGTVIPSSEVYITTNGAGRAENLVIQTIVQLSQNDYIEIFIENSTAVTNITVSSLNVIIK